jgi:hypothetical protein
MMSKPCGLTIDGPGIATYTIPTDGPDGKEADGTLEWNATTMVVVEVRAGGKAGIGYTYADAVAARLVASKPKDGPFDFDPDETTRFLVFGKHGFEYENEYCCAGYEYASDAIYSDSIFIPFLDCATLRPYKRGTLHPRIIHGCHRKKPGKIPGNGKPAQCVFCRV